MINDGKVVKELNRKHLILEIVYMIFNFIFRRIYQKKKYRLVQIKDLE